MHRLKILNKEGYIGEYKHILDIGYFKEFNFKSENIGCFIFLMCNGKKRSFVKELGNY